MKKGTSRLRLKREGKKDRSSSTSSQDPSPTEPLDPSSPSSSASVPVVSENAPSEGLSTRPPSSAMPSRLPSPNLVGQLLQEADRKRFRLREVEDKRASMMGAAPISLQNPMPSFEQPDETSASPAPRSGTEGVTQQKPFIRSPHSSNADTKVQRPVAPGPGTGAPALPPKRRGTASLPVITSVSALKQDPSPQETQGPSVPSSSSPKTSPPASPPPSGPSSATPTQTPLVSSLPLQDTPEVSEASQASPRGDASDRLHQQRMRQQVIDELVTTEVDYIRDLKLIVSV